MRAPRRSRNRGGPEIRAAAAPWVAMTSLRSSVAPEWRGFHTGWTARGQERAVFVAFRDGSARCSVRRVFALLRIPQRMRLRQHVCVDGFDIILCQNVLERSHAAV